MKRILFIALTALFVANTVGYSEDVVFGNVKLAGVRGKQTDATLIFSDTEKSVLVHLPHRGLVSIPYSEIDKLSTEYTKKHRIAAGTLLISVTGTSSELITPSKSKTNWLYIDYHDNDSKELVVLKLEKKDVQKISEAAKVHTGQEIVDLGNAGKKKSRTASGL